MLYCVMFVCECVCVSVCVCVCVHKGAQTVRGERSGMVSASAQQQSGSNNYLQGCVCVRVCACVCVCGCVGVRVGSTVVETPQYGDLFSSFSDQPLHLSASLQDPFTHTHTHTD